MAKYGRLLRIMAINPIRDAKKQVTPVAVTTIRLYKIISNKHCNAINVNCHLKLYTLQLITLKYVGKLSIK